ncbi:hypothetical protein COOONC_01046 [Cooperia oncophora]
MEPILKTMFLYNIGTGDYASPHPFSVEADGRYFEPLQFTVPSNRQERPFLHGISADELQLTQDPFIVAGSIRLLKTRLM